MGMRTEFGKEPPIRQPAEDTLEQRRAENRRNLMAAKHLRISLRRSSLARWNHRDGFPGSDFEIRSSGL